MIFRIIRIYFALIYNTNSLHEMKGTMYQYQTLHCYHFNSQVKDIFEQNAASQNS